MKNTLVFLIFFSCNFLVTSQSNTCKNLEKSIEDYEVFYRANKNSLDTKPRYAKAYLVAVDICSCEKSIFDDMELAIELLEKIKLKEESLKFKKGKVSEALDFCRETREILSSIEYIDDIGYSSGTRNSYFYSKRYRLKLEYSEDVETTDVLLMAAQEEERNRGSLKSSKKSSKTKSKFAYTGLNEKTFFRIIKILKTFK